MQLVTKAAHKAVRGLKLLGTLGKYTDPWLANASSLTYNPDLGYVIEVDVDEEHEEQLKGIVERMGLELV